MTNDYIRKLTVRKKPKLILICTLYNLDENTKAESWAADILRILGYDATPWVIQALLKNIFVHITSQIKYEDIWPEEDTDNPDGGPPKTRVAAVELARALDGKDSRDYENRVEPSVWGGKKMAGEIVRRMREEYDFPAVGGGSGSSSASAGTRMEG